MRVLFLSLLLPLLTLSCVFAAKPTAVPTTVFSQADATRVQKYLTSVQQKDGTFGDALTTSHATSTFALISTTVPHAKDICSHTLSALNAAKDVPTVTPLVTTLISSSCDFNLPSTIKTLLQQGLTSKSLPTLYTTTRAIISLIKAKRASVGDFDLSTVSKTVIDLLEDDGTYRISSDADSDATAYHAGMALHILGDVFSSTPEMEETSRTAIRQATKKISDLIKLGGDNLDYTLGTDVSQIEAASVVIRGVITFANAVSEAVEVTDNQINRFANLFLTNQYTHDVAELHATLAALYAIAGNNIYVPVVLTVVESTPSAVRVRVTNVVDGFATKLGVQLSSITSADGTVIASNIALTPKSEDSVEYTLPSTPAWNKAEPGFYTLKFTLEAKSGFSGGERYKLNGVYTRTTKVVTDVTGGEFSASVSESAKGLETDQVARASHPSSLKSKLAVDTSKYLHLKIQILAKIQPNQVFIQLIKSGKSAIFVAKHSNNGNYALKLNFGSSEVTEALYGSGDYEVYVLVGDSLLAHGLRWRVATVAATIPDATSHDDDTVFQPKPEIKHIFRQPDPRPSRFVALIFSALVLVPLAGFILSLLRFGVRLSLPTNPSELLSAVIFQGSIGAILVLYILYWLHLNIFQALAGGAVLGVIAICSGNSALRALHVRTADGKSKAE